jgi:predicted nuclease with TOPRIM domain
VAIVAVTGAAVGTSPMKKLFERLYEHALTWDRIFQEHPAYRDPALIRDLKEASEVLLHADGERWADAEKRYPEMMEYLRNLKAGEIERLRKRATDAEQLTRDALKVSTAEIERLRAHLDHREKEISRLEGECVIRSNEIGRLRTALRVNALRHGATDAEINAVLYPEQSVAAGVDTMAPEHSVSAPGKPSSRGS